MKVWNKMKIRQLCYNTILNIFNNKVGFERLYPELLVNLNDQEKSRLINYVNTFFRNFSFVEEILIKRVEKKIDNQDLETGTLLLVAACEYLFLDKSVPYAIVNDYVEIAKKRLGKNKSRFINAILRKITSLDKSELKDLLTGYQAAITNHPEWVFNKWIEAFGKPVAKEICLFNQNIPKIYTRVNSFKISSLEMQKLFKEEGIISSILPEKIFSDYLEISEGNVLNSKYFEKGYFYIQEPSHALAVKLLEPNKNNKILDLCSAPGGKSTYIQELTKNKAYLELNDISQKKRVLIKQNFKRLGLKFNKLTFLDASEFTSFVEFDKILIDAPCSGSGNFRRHPESRWNKDEELLLNLRKIQLKALDKVKYHIPVGGSLIYSTCSLFDEENIDIVNEFLKENEDYELEDSTNEDLAKFKYEKGGYLLNPGIHGYEGAYCARIVRKKKDS